MIPPAIQARVLETDQRLKTGYQRSNVAAFVAIAHKAGESQIIFCGLACVLLAENMIDLAPEKRIVFVKQAILAQVIRPRPDKPTQR